tara:strand:- start:355251 stop:357314 length:2064 start_codon:yes stop_codon:yes gene_type:complete
MSTIGKIRKRSGLLIIVIGLAMAAFILGDFFSSRGQTNSVVVGEIAGDDIDLQDFDRRVQNEVDAVKQANPNLTEAQANQIRNQVWNMIVREKIFYPQLNELGMVVSKEEYDDIRFGENVLPDLQNDQTFRDQETGQFNKSNVQQYFVYLQQNFPALWETQKQSIISSRLGAKYNTLLKKGIVINSVEAKDDAAAKANTISLEFVQQKYASIPDSVVTVTDADIQAYYNAHKGEAKYKQTVNRTADFVVFNVEASEKDKEDIKNELNRLKADFETTDNDSAFVTLNNDVPFQRAQTYAPGTFASVDSLIVNAEAGTVVGPFVNNGNMFLTKVIFNGEDKEVNAKHILLTPDANNSVEALKLKADSLMKVAKKKNNFSELAKEFSTDKGSAVNGGDLDWFGRGRMVPSFEKGAYATKKGGMTIVESQFGVHLIQVVDTRPVDLITVANISRVIEPSSATIDAAYNKASQLSISYNTAKEFLAEAGKEYNLLSATNIAPNATFVPGVNGDPKDFVRWMFRAELNEVSDALEINNQIIVAALTQVNEEGEPKLSAVRDRMEREVIKEKKAELLKAKFQGSTLAEIATAVGGRVETANNVSFSNAVLTGAGREPKVIGKALASKENEVSPVIAGENGVYVFAVTSISEAANLSPEVSKTTLQNNIANRVDFSAYNALLEKEGVKDERYKFY